MKVCSCRDFDCAATRKAIETHTPEHAEDVHRLITGKPPNCGTCLSLVDAMLERYRKDGVVPNPLEVSREENRAAQKRLGERFTNDNSEASDEPPAYKRRYIRWLENNM